MTAPSDNALYAELAEAELERRRTKAEADRAEATCKALREQVLARMMEDGVQSVSAGGVTLYVHRQLWAGVEYREGETTDEAYSRACAAMTAAGLGEYVQPRFNLSSVSALYRERSKVEDWDDPSDLLEPELVGALKITDTYDVRSRVTGKE